MVEPRLSLIASVIADEIRAHDWSDSPYRRDGAGHKHDDDPKASNLTQLSDSQTEAVRTNVMWVTGQALGFLGVLRPEDVYAWADACGVDTRTSSGRANSGHIKYGFRFDKQGNFLPPGARWLIPGEAPGPVNRDGKTRAEMERDTERRVNKLAGHPGPWSPQDTKPGTGPYVAINVAVNSVNKWLSARNMNARVTQEELWEYIKNRLLDADDNARIRLNDLRRWFEDVYLPACRAVEIDDF